MRKILSFFYRALNRLLCGAGFQLTRLPQSDTVINPAERSIARGLSTKEHNSRENMDAFYNDPQLLTHYFTKERLEFYQGVRERLAALQLQPATVLDVGCGSGHLLAEIRRLYPAADLLGVDFSGESIRLARTLNSGMTFDECSIFDLARLARSFDLVLCTEVLEHLEDADIAMEHLMATCRPGGCVFITVPHGRTDTFAGHFNFWTEASFRREFRKFDPEISVFGTYLCAVIRRP